MHDFYDLRAATVNKYSGSSPLVVGTHKWHLLHNQWISINMRISKVNKGRKCVNPSSTSLDLKCVLFSKYFKVVNNADVTKYLSFTVKV